MILPVGITLREWADNLVRDFPADNVPILGSDDTWREWAAVVISLPSFADPASPNPYEYPDWEPWAERMVALVTSE